MENYWTLRNKLLSECKNSIPEFPSFVFGNSKCGMLFEIVIVDWIVRICSFWNCLWLLFFLSSDVVVWVFEI